MLVVPMLCQEIFSSKMPKLNCSFICSTNTDYHMSSQKMCLSMLCIVNSSNPSSMSSIKNVPCLRAIAKYWSNGNFLLSFPIVGIVNAIPKIYVNSQNSKQDCELSEFRYYFCKFEHVLYIRSTFHIVCNNITTLQLGS